MPDYARLFRNGGSQAVRLPREYRFPGDQVRISRAPGGGVLLEPVERPSFRSTEEWFAAMDAAGLGALFPEGEDWRQQPPMPEAPRFDLDDDEAEGPAGDGR